MTKELTAVEVESILKKGAICELSPDCRYMIVFDRPSISAKGVERLQEHLLNKMGVRSIVIRENSAFSPMRIFELLFK